MAEKPTSDELLLNERFTSREGLYIRNILSKTYLRPIFGYISEWEKDKHEKLTHGKTLIVTLGIAPTSHFLKIPKHKVKLKEIAGNIIDVDYAPYKVVPWFSAERLLNASKIMDKLTLDLFKRLEKIENA